MRRFRHAMIISFIILGKINSYSQSKELIDSFNRINSILSDYEVGVSETEYKSYRYKVEKLKFTYKYPDITISYELMSEERDIYNYSKMKKVFFDRRIVSFPVSELTIKSFSGTPSYGNHELWLSCESGIEKTEFGKKNIIDYWKFHGTSLLMKKLETEISAFKELAQGYTGSLGESKLNNNSTAISSSKSNSNNSTSISSKKTIQMERSSDNTFRIPCKVNGLSLKFIFDTGAATVVLSLTEAKFMIKQGLITQKDIVGSSYHSIADGSITEGTTVILRKIEIGGLILNNVEASVIHTQNAPLLLGQNVLRRLGKIQIDYQNSTLTIIKE